MTALTLLTTMFAFAGFMMVYTYAALVFDRATGGDGRVLAGFLLVWGVFATFGNIVVGRLVDRFGSRAIINGLLLVAVANFCLLPWSSANQTTSALALAVWGVCCWGLIVPQQHRLVASAPHVAPLLLAFNNTATYGGLACSAFLGGLIVQVVDYHFLSLFGVAWLGVALAFAEAAHAMSSKKLSPATRTDVTDSRGSQDQGCAPCQVYFDIRLGGEGPNIPARPRLSPKPIGGSMNRHAHPSCRRLAVSAEDSAFGPWRT